MAVREKTSTQPRIRIKTGVEAVKTQQDSNFRMIALETAARVSGSAGQPGTVIAAAEKFYAFLTGK